MRKIRRRFRENTETKEMDERRYAYKELSGDIVWYIDSSDMVADAIVYEDDEEFEDEMYSLTHFKDYDEVERPDYSTLRPILKYLGDWLPIYRVEYSRPQFTGRFIHYKTKEIVDKLPKANIPVECSWYVERFDDYDSDLEYITIYPDEMTCWDDISEHDLAMFNRFMNGQGQDEWIPLENFIDGDY